MLNVEAITTLATAAVTIFSGVFWLMKINHKQQEKITELEEDMYAKNISELKKIVGSFESQLLDHKGELRDLSQKLGTYIDQNENRFKTVDYQMERIMRHFVS